MLTVYVWGAIGPGLLFWRSAEIGGDCRLKGAPVGAGIAFNGNVRNQLARFVAVKHEFESTLADAERPGQRGFPSRRHAIDDGRWLQSARIRSALFLHADPME